MNIRSFSALCSAALLASSFAWPAAIAADKKPAKQGNVFHLQETSLLDGDGRQAVMRGEYAQCSTEPFKAVKAYPKLNSKQPLYGKLQFDRSLANIEGVAIYFVLDESGKIPRSAENADKTTEKPGEKMTDKRPPAKPKLSSYDRLYIDVNRDGDLTNDPALKPMKNPPWKVLPGYESKERMAFELAHIPVDFGPGVGLKPFAVFPWFMVTGDEEHPTTMHFVATTARKGIIKLGTDEYDAMLAQECTLTGRFDRPITSLHLTSRNGAPRLPSSGFDSELLMTMRRAGDQFYTIAASPQGDTLTVEPYRGAFGVFKLGPGSRKLKSIGFHGSFRSKKTALAIEPDGSDLAAGKKTTKCQLPVGDYLPSYLTIDYGGLRISLSDNYHAEGHPRDIQRGRPYTFHIRPDKPFVLDFSNKPAVIFASPATDKPIKLGDEVRVAAVLVDPKLDIMIRRMDDPSKTKKETVKYRVGKEMKEYTYDKPLSLDPTVTITNSAGKKVAEGVMPFG